MTSSMRVIQLILIVFIIGSQNGTLAIRCYHCSFFEETRVSDGYDMLADNNERKPFGYDSSCVQGHEPNKSLIFDCETEYPTILKRMLKDEPSSDTSFDRFIDEMIEKLVQSSRNADMHCGAAFVNGNENKHGEELNTKVVYRSCFSNSTRLPHYLSELQDGYTGMSVSGYTCEHEDLCNGKDHNDFETRRIASSSSRNIPVCGGLLLAVIVVTFIKKA